MKNNTSDCAEISYACFEPLYLLRAISSLLVQFEMSCCRTFWITLIIIGRKFWSTEINCEIWHACFEPLYAPMFLNSCIYLNTPRNYWMDILVNRNQFCHSSRQKTKVWNIRSGKNCLTGDLYGRFGRPISDLDSNLFTALTER